MGIGTVGSVKVYVLSAFTGNVRLLRIRLVKSKLGMLLITRVILKPLPCAPSDAR